MGLSVLGEPVALVRMNGGIVALRDVCAHMDASLSGGWVMRGAQGEELVCPNHRWRYDAAGRCTHIPELGDEQVIPDWTRVAAYATCERHGVIWVCLDPASGEDIPHLAALDDPRYQQLAVQSRVWKAPAETVIERFVASAASALGAGELTRFASPLSVAWAPDESHSSLRAILFTVTPLTRKACRSFWIAAAECGEPVGEAAIDAIEVDVETINEHAHDLFCEAMAG